MSDATGMAEEDVDIYLNLPNFQYDESLTKLEKENTKLKRKMSVMEDRLQTLSKALSLCIKERDQVSKNMSCLYLSAKHEINRKDKLIADLRNRNKEYAERLSGKPQPASTSGKPIEKPGNSSTNKDNTGRPQPPSTSGITGRNKDNPAQLTGGSHTTSASGKTTEETGARMQSCNKVPNSVLNNRTANSSAQKQDCNKTLNNSIGSSSHDKNNSLNQNTEIRKREENKTPIVLPRLRGPHTVYSIRRYKELYGKNPVKRNRYDRTLHSQRTVAVPRRILLRPPVATESGVTSKYPNKPIETKQFYNGKGSNTTKSTEFKLTPIDLKTPQVRRENTRLRSIKEKLSEVIKDIKEPYKVFNTNKGGLNNFKRVTEVSSTCGPKTLKFIAKEVLNSIVPESTSHLESVDKEVTNINNLERLNQKESTENKKDKSLKDTLLNLFGNDVSNPSSPDKESTCVPKKQEEILKEKQGEILKDNSEKCPEKSPPYITQIKSLTRVSRVPSSSSRVKPGNTKSVPKINEVKEKISTKSIKSEPEIVDPTRFQPKIFGSELGKVTEKKNETCNLNENSCLTSASEDTVAMIRKSLRVHPTISPIKTPKKQVNSPIKSNEVNAFSSISTVNSCKPESMRIVPLSKTPVHKPNSTKTDDKETSVSPNSWTVFKKDNVSVSINCEQGEFKRSKRTYSISFSSSSVSGSEKDSSNKNETCKRNHESAKVPTSNDVKRFKNEPNKTEVSTSNRHNNRGHSKLDEDYRKKYGRSRSISRRSVDLRVRGLHRDHREVLDQKLRARLRHKSRWRNR